MRVLPDQQGQSRRGARYSYILVTSILNKRVYEATVARCGKDGRRCLNAANLRRSRPAPEAPVCTSLRDRNAVPRGRPDLDLQPDPDRQKGITSFACPTGGSGGNLYAGCMTAPCKTTGKTDPSTGLPLVHCTCPTFDGPNQVGNPQIKEGDFSCSPSPNVWSSAYQYPAFERPAALSRAVGARIDHGYRPAGSRCFDLGPQVFFYGLSELSRVSKYMIQYSPTL